MREVASPSPLEFTLGDVIHALAKAIDRISPMVHRHHLGVAYMSHAIARRMNLDAQSRTELLLAALIHDVGALSLGDRLDTMAFETTNTLHAELGYRLVFPFKPLARSAEIIRHHHAPWEALQSGIQVPLESQILALADRVDVLFDRVTYPLFQQERILKQIRPLVGHAFSPLAWEAFEGLAQRESFWLDAFNCADTYVEELFQGLAFPPLTWEALLELAVMISQIIDFRNRFTATHTAGVSAVAAALAQAEGMSAPEVLKMRVAGFFHDLGKIAIPGELLMMPRSLTLDEFCIVKSHAYHTKRILDTLHGLETVVRWGAFHHERLSGSGYPFRYGEPELDLGCRIMAVADVFTALTEDRPYRSGMSRQEAMDTILHMAQARELDGEIPMELEKRFEEINEIRRQAQAMALHSYQAFTSDLQKAG